MTLKTVLGGLLLCFSVYHIPAAFSAQLSGEELMRFQKLPAVVPDDFSGDVRNMPDGPELSPDAEPRVIPEGQMPDGSGDGWDRGVPVQSTEGLVGPDPVLQPEGSELPNTQSDGVNFEGQGFTNVAPPDTVGDVGTDYYIQMTNHSSGSTFTIFNKSDGSVASTAKVLDTLVPTGTNCKTGGGDPIVVYDDLAERWVMLEFVDRTVENRLCIYISKTGNPVTGGWRLYTIGTPAFPDYPKVGVWPNGYYITTYEGDRLGLYVLERSKALAGLTARSLRASISSLTPSPGIRDTRWLPADADGDAPPPGGAIARHYAFRSVDASQDTSNPTDRLEIWYSDVDWDGNTSGTLLTTITDSFRLITCSPGIRDCIAQPGTTVKLDALTNRPMSRLQYRNFGDREAMVVNQSVNASIKKPRAGIRWWELSRTGGDWNVRQKSTFSPNLTNRWMASIAMDKAGNMGLGYSVSSSNVFPGIRFTGREEGRDPLNTMQSETVLIDGSSAQTMSWMNHRWGDYSSMSVDPADDCTFWYTNEYMPIGGQWSTRIGSFKFDSCGEDSSFYVVPLPNGGASVFDL